MKIMERVVMVLILLAMVGGGAWIYFGVQHEQEEVRQAVARGEYEIPDAGPSNYSEDNWTEIYPSTVPIRIASTSVNASVADTLPERIMGLSNTPFLPSNVVKLFVFDAYGEHEIWMKDMNYAIDILWADKEGFIVHIEENVSPETFPKSFGSPTPAWYVVETSAGFVVDNNITIGDKVSI